MYLSKSKFCTAYQCLKELWLKENKPEEISESKNGSKPKKVSKGKKKNDEKV